ncbi:hypothetical protein [Sulfurovum sp. NBC37-1]|uniref:hypothetical protein n=1 Tax=Sulfurovum sp. (strain NBC37-1) TaxID=387093 RepID=UPI0001587B5A|nr:hypothetical protein [Sulfurovum sp. NBC37-1]BAF73385.1 hypothetical protein SUN_2451 [Sulfurovum sp. NBC37-1]
MFPFKTYYKLIGKNIVNTNYINFYRVLRFIGKANYCSSRKCVDCAIKILRQRLNSKNVKGVSKTEITNLIKERKTFNKKNYVYKISTRADKILSVLFDLLKEAESKQGVRISDSSFNHIKQDIYCKKQIISAIDDKLDLIVEKTPQKHKSVSEEFQSNFDRIKKVC